MASFARLLMVLVGLLASADLGHAKVFERCELANELRSRGVSEKQLADWVCLAYHESRYDTAAVGRLNWDQSVDHGLFQISDIYWCDWSSDEPDRQYKNVCNKNCNYRIQRLTIRAEETQSCTGSPGLGSMVPAL